MPNHTENILRVTGPLPKLAEFEALCVGCSPKYPQSRVEGELGIKDEESVADCLTFAGICPVPSEVLAAGFDPAGYDWQCSNWGTKWDAYGPPVLLRAPRGDLVYMFRTAWSPPRPWLRAAAQRFTELRFELFARDEYPYCVTIEASHDEDGLNWEECYGEQKEPSNVTPASDVDALRALLADHEENVRGHADTAARGDRVAAREWSAMESKSRSALLAQLAALDADVARLKEALHLVGRNDRSGEYRYGEARRIDGVKPGPGQRWKTPREIATDELRALAAPTEPAEKEAPANG